MHLLSLTVIKQLQNIALEASDPRKQQQQGNYKTKHTCRMDNINLRERSKQILQQKKQPTGRNNESEAWYNSQLILKKADLRKRKQKYTKKQPVQ
jgi:hypothetical protein